MAFTMLKTTPTYIGVRVSPVAVKVAPSAMPGNIATKPAIIGTR